jgi:hypothetical protein
MKRILVFCLVLAMALSLIGCGCKHNAAELLLHDVDTENLTAKWQVTCVDCGEILEYRDAATGVAPSNGKLKLDADSWHKCLMTNISRLGAGQTLYAYPVESEDEALLHAVVSMSQMNTVFSYRDLEGNVITKQQSSNPDQVHSICIEAQFTNDNAKEFYILLMITAINNNSSLAPEDANTLAAQIMSGNPATDNGYTYQMEILSVEDHTVRVTITAEQ